MVEPPAPAAPRLDIGRVIGLSFAIMRQRWAALGFFLLAYLALEWTFARFVRLNVQNGRHDLSLALSIALYLGFECLVWFRDTALIAAALRRSSSGFAASIADAARTALRVLPTVLPFFAFTELPGIGRTLWRRWAGDGQLPAGQLTELLAAVGFAELAFALVATACWGVVVPSAIVEGGGLRAALARAWRLLSGSRWRFVAIYVVILVIGALPGMLASVLSLATMEALRATGYAPGYFQLEFGIAGVLSSIVMATWRVAIPVAYLELRRMKEGVVVGDVAAVFA